MATRNEWRKDQNALTRDILERVDSIAFSFDLSGRNKGCTLNHLDGSYGYITLQDALSGDWRVFDYTTDEVLATYNSISAVIKGGWKVST
ncbi:hypothetical protein SpiGrapes_2383 [Sphaerochaeta pleomorpha str. Grapes]|uniref:Uncharacterized protein n=1 Tax=Sphaerochaeta pleomorpha (strain ATCC BAA-1885 / DSM 22778 / Grapes) TaxID=158190 RepID=G8QSX3_SPHPG|nr:hypothetical protein [Sphaerochaeta pleomorpha]AEV30155.1 hypothetical protein SpiGrapes_2383 [Sphaerochaeta pleomorpha str. Grapes]